MIKKRDLGQTSWVHIPALTLGLNFFIWKLGVIKISFLQEYVKE